MGEVIDFVKHLVNNNIDYKVHETPQQGKYSIDPAMLEEVQVSSFMCGDDRVDIEVFKESDLIRIIIIDNESNEAYSQYTFDARELQMILMCLDLLANMEVENNE